MAKITENLDADQYVVTKNGDVVAESTDIIEAYSHYWLILKDDIECDGPQQLGGRLSDRYTLRAYEGSKPFKLGDHIDDLDGTEWTIEYVKGRNYDETERVAREKRRTQCIING